MFVDYYKKENFLFFKINYIKIPYMLILNDYITFTKAT